MISMDIFYWLAMRSETADLRSMQRPCQLRLTGRQLA